MAQSDYDGIPYNRAITRFAIMVGSEGVSFADKMAPPTRVEDQGFSYPIFTNPDESKGKTNDTIGPDGRPNVRESVKFRLEAGFCNRRGLRGVIKRELTKGPLARFYATAQTETAQNVNELRYRMEKNVKAMLLTASTTSGFYASPSVKWDAAGLTGVVAISDAEAAIDAAMGNALSDTMSGGMWEAYTNKTVGRAYGRYLREIKKYGDSAFLEGGIYPRELAGLPLNIAGIRENTARAGQTPTYASVWSEDNVYLVYTNPAFATSQQTFTAMAQFYWEGLTARYGTKVFDHPEADVLQTIVSTDVFDELKMLSMAGMYVLTDVLT